MDINTLNKSIQQIIERKSLFLVVVVLLIFFMIGAALFGDYSSKRVNYQNQIKEKLNRNSVVDDYDKSMAQFNEYASSLAKSATGDALIQLEDYASQYNINVLNASPGEVQEHGYYSSIGFHLSVRVGDFKDLISFLQTVENSPFRFKVDYYTATMADVNTGSINCEINITSTQIKL